MSAQQRIKEKLKEIFDEGQVNAMSVFKGYSLQTNQTGWHYIPYNGQAVYMGKSVVDVGIWVDEQGIELTLEKTRSSTNSISFTFNQENKDFKIIK